MGARKAQRRQSKDHRQAEVAKVDCRSSYRLKKARSPVLSVEEEAVIVAFRKDTLLPLDGCLYALRRIIPHLTRWSLHRCLRHHGDITAAEGRVRSFA
jgi:hypothetical protein